MTRVAGKARAGEFRRRAAEGHDDRCAQRGGHVHRAGVVGEENPAQLQQRHEFAQRSFSRYVDRAVSRQAADTITEFAVIRSPKYQPHA